MNSDDVDSQQWLAALSEVESLQPKFIIPGHGRPSKATKEAIAFTRDYIQFLRTAMAAAVQNWTEFNTAYRQTDWSKYEKMPAFEATNRGNAYRIYIELEKREFNAPKP
jgi:glyoxylase-like metal-dependent hydrolase (beta-lactamase superfamily II)